MAKVYRAAAAEAVHYCCRYLDLSANTGKLYILPLEADIEIGRRVRCSFP